jgi:hypothetical protein
VAARDLIQGADEPYSDAWWLENLGKKLYGRFDRIELLDRYYRGNPPLPEGADNSASAYQKFQRKARMNLAELVVEATRQRMKPVGFRTGADGDDNGDKEARRVWGYNDLDVESADVHQMMLALGDAYTIVGQDDDGEPVITAEDPRQVVTASDPRMRRKVVAGLKVFRDEIAGIDRAYLYLPGRVRQAYKETSKVAPVLAMGFRANDWSWIDGGVDLPASMGDLVPVVRFRNARGMGEFEMHLDHLDRINHMILQRMVVATMQAFRQRAIQGELPTHDDQGNLIDYNQLFVADPGALWTMPEGTAIWESAQVDLGPLLEAVHADVMHLAAVTFTPAHYMLSDSGRQAGSAEAAQLTREGLVFKTEDRINRASVGWKQTMSLAFRLKGDAKRADLTALEPIWAPAERLTLAERADAASKAIDVPWRSKMLELWNFDPEVVDRMETERGQDAFNLLLAQTANGQALGQQQPGQQGGQQAGQQAPAQRQPQPAGA